MKWYKPVAVIIALFLYAFLLNQLGFLLVTFGLMILLYGLGRPGTWITIGGLCLLRVLVIAGGNHVRYGFGIPRRMFRRIPSSYQLIGSEELNIPEDKRDRLMDVNKPAYPMPPYHFMTFTAYEDLPQPGVKLGIMLDKAEGGLLIKGIIPGSVAEHNGLLENDLLTQIGNQQLLEPFDLIYELQQKKIGDTVELHLLRQGEPLVKSIEFKENNQHPSM